MMCGARADLKTKSQLRLRHATLEYYFDGVVAPLHYSAQQSVSVTVACARSFTMAPELRRSLLR